jgi:hypothetical protein
MTSQNSRRKPQHRRRDSDAPYAPTALHELNVLIGLPSTTSLQPKQATDGIYRRCSKALPVATVDSTSCRPHLPSMLIAITVRPNHYIQPCPARANTHTPSNDQALLNLDPFPCNPFHCCMHRISRACTRSGTSLTTQ